MGMQTPEDHHDVSDETLMQRVGKGDMDAFSLLVQRHQNGVVNFFRRMGDYNGAEDRAQETFVRLFKYRKRYRPTAKFTTFLYLLARRARIDNLRKMERRRRAYERLTDEEETRRQETRAGALAGEDAVAALSALSEDMRTVVVMSIFQGFKYREIADVLGIPLGTVKTRMFHALRKLKEVMSHDATP